MADATISTITPLADAGLSDKEIRLLAAAWLSSSSTDLDIDRFAVIAGYPSAVNARKRLNEAKSKARARIFAPGGSSSASATTGDNVGSEKGDSSPAPKTPVKTPRTPKSAGKRKNTAKGSSDGSPLKRGRTLKRDNAEEDETHGKLDGSATQSEHLAENTDNV